MRKTIAGVLLSAVLLITFIGVIRHYDRCVATLEADILRISHERDDAIVKASLLDTEVLRLEASLAENTSTLIAAMPPEGDQRFESALLCKRGQAVIC